MIKHAWSISKKSESQAIRPIPNLKSTIFLDLRFAPFPDGQLDIFINR